MAAYPVSCFIELMNSPKTFLRSITNMVFEEEIYIDKLQSLVRSHVLSLALASVHSQDESVRDEALWAAANLMAANNKELREFTAKCVVEQNIAAAAARSYRNDSTLTAKSAAYFLYNWAPRIEDEVSAKRFIMDLLSIALVRKGGVSDLLWAAIRVAKRLPRAIPVHMLTTALRNENMSPKRRSLIWRLIGIAAEEMGLVDGCIDTLMLRLETYLPKAKTDKARCELLWILSNLLCEEKGVGVFHYKYFSLRRAVERIAWTSTGAVLHEAMMALANYVVKATDKEIHRYLATDESLALLFRTYARYSNSVIARISKEALDAVEKYIAENHQEPEVVDLTDADDDDMTVSEIAPNDEDDVLNTEFVIDNDPVPSAYELLAGDFRGNETAAVRGLVAMLRDKPVGSWVALPPNYLLTIADLTNLQHMGYMIKDGYMGINPEIYGGNV